MKELKILKDKRDELKIRLESHRDESLAIRKGNDMTESRLLEDLHFTEIRIKNLEVDGLIPSKGDDE